MAHLTAQLVARHRRQALAPRELRALDDHGAMCAPCRDLIATQLTERSPGRSPAPSFLDEANAPPFHASEAELAAYARGDVDEIDREVIECHLGLCARCSASLLAVVNCRFRHQPVPG